MFFLSLYPEHRLPGRVQSPDLGRENAGWPAVVYFCVFSAALTGGIIRTNVSSTAPRRNVQRKQGESPLLREECVLKMTSSSDDSQLIYIYIFITECCSNYI